MTPPIAPEIWWPSPASAAGVPLPAGENLAKSTQALSPSTHLCPKENTLTHSPLPQQTPGYSLRVTVLLPHQQSSLSLLSDSQFPMCGSNGGLTARSPSRAVKVLSWLGFLQKQTLTQDSRATGSFRRLSRDTLAKDWEAQMWWALWGPAQIPWEGNLSVTGRASALSPPLRLPWLRKTASPKVRPPSWHSPYPVTNHCKV